MGCSLKCGETSGFDPLFLDCGETPCTPFLFVSAGSVVLSLHPLDDDFFFSLQANGMCSGENYRPYRAWSDEELEDLAEEVHPEETGFVHHEVC